ncbi:YciI family protein [Cumulibacter manganitolerans]|uniref:YciI family protein n=1 Tax=Cumulibacter manganitolerans TaxID=1884992 RepID=UPI0012953A4B|nr:YciI family protein [Cumulibacter manganitolerans]
MPTFITVGYGDRAGYDRTPPAVRDDAHAHDDRLRAAGARMGIAGTPVQVRNPDAAGPRTTIGPYLQSALPVAGFALIEAADLDEAIALAAQTPCAVAHGVVEVWPLTETPDGTAP